MAVTVTTEFGIDDYKNATGWHVDEHSQLHIFKKAESVTTSLGSYSSGTWHSVNVAEETKMMS